MNKKSILQLAAFIICCVIMYLGVYHQRVTGESPEANWLLVAAGTILPAFAIVYVSEWIRQRFPRKSRS